MSRAVVRLPVAVQLAALAALVSPAATSAMAAAAAMRLRRAFRALEYATMLRVLPMGRVRDEARP